MANAQETSYEEAIEYYNNEDYISAIERFESLEQEGYNSFNLNYNLGNAHFKQGNLGKSILYFERALKLNPTDKDVAHNLSLANAQIVDRIETLPPLFIVQWWNRLLTSMHSNSWGRLLLVSIGLICLLVLLKHLYKPLPSRIGYIVLVLFFSVSSFILGAITYSSFVYENKSSEGILLVTKQKVRSAPDDKATVSFTVFEGSKMEIEDRLGEWIKISLTGNKSGWIPDNAIEKI